MDSKWGREIVRLKGAIEMRPQLNGATVDPNPVTGIEVLSLLYSYTAHGVLSY